MTAEQQPITELTAIEVDYLSGGGSSEGKSREAGESWGRRIGQWIEDTAEAAVNEVKSWFS
jgi:hypothetical protein